MTNMVSCKKNGCNFMQVYMGMLSTTFLAKVMSWDLFFLKYGLDKEVHYPHKYYDH